MTQPDWVGVHALDGQMTAWAMQGSTALQSLSAQGVPTQDSLLALIGPWLADAPMPVLVSGGGGPAQPVPSGPATRPVPVSVADPRLLVAQIPSLSQTEPPDQMQGQVSLIAGFLALNPGWDGVICLPGQQSVWAHVSADEVVSFQTFLTAEMAGMLAAHPSIDRGWEDGAFDGALPTTLARPERLMAALSSLRAASDASMAQLWGLLIGAELAAAKSYWLGQNLAVIGADAPARLYAHALETQGVPATLADAPRMALAGLVAAYRAS